MPKPTKIVAACAAVLGASEAQTEPFSDRFLPENTERWHIAEYDFRHPAFDTDWRRSQVTIANGLTLSLSPQVNAENGFISGAVRSQKRSRFGRYSIDLRAGQGDGVITGFFTYTGPAYGTRHDEIDIEILGKTPTRVHLAWFVDGKRYEKDVELGFDATRCVHTYEFEWHPNGISWFVNGGLVFSLSRETAPIPEVPGYVFANLWAADPSIGSWAGYANENHSTSALIKQISFKPYLMVHTES